MAEEREEPAAAPGSRVDAAQRRKRIPVTVRVIGIGLVPAEERGEQEPIFAVIGAERKEASTSSAVAPVLTIKAQQGVEVVVVLLPPVPGQEERHGGPVVGHVRRRALLERVERREKAAVILCLPGKEQGPRVAGVGRVIAQIVVAPYKPDMPRLFAGTGVVMRQRPAQPVVVLSEVPVLPCVSIADPEREERMGLILVVLEEREEDVIVLLSVALALALAPEAGEDAVVAAFCVGLAERPEQVVFPVRPGVAIG